MRGQPPLFYPPLCIALSRCRSLPSNTVLSPPGGCCLARLLRACHRRKSGIVGALTSFGGSMVDRSAGSNRTVAAGESWSNKLVVTVGRGRDTSWAEGPAHTPTQCRVLTNAGTNDRLHSLNRCSLCRPQRSGRHHSRSRSCWPRSSQRSPGTSDGPTTYSLETSMGTRKMAHHQSLVAPSSQRGAHDCQLAQRILWVLAGPSAQQVSRVYMRCRSSR